MKALITIVVASFALGVASAQQPQQPPARDGAVRALPAGTAVVSGVVRTDDANPRPIRGAAVTLNHTEKLYGDTAITDDQGRFEFRTVPGGRYLVAAEKEPFVRTRYGAARPGRAGTPIAVADGQRVTGLALRLVRGGIITGRVIGTDGEPAENATIDVQQSVTIGGERRLVDVNTPGHSTTDDLGVYRIWGLPAGDYIVQATPRAGYHGQGFAVRPTTAADVSWARSQQLAGLAGDLRAGATPPPGPILGLAPIYYQGTLQKASATVVTVGPGEERAGIDFNLQLITTSRIECTVVGANGTAPATVTSVFLVETGGNTSGFSGYRESMGTRVVFAGVAPGAYSIAALVEDTKEWAMADLTVGNQDISTTLTLQPGLTATGRITFQGTTAPPELSRMRLWLEPVGTPGGLSLEPTPGKVNADGTFEIAGLVAGGYRLNASLSDARAATPGSGWVMRSALAGRQDIADTPLDIRAGVPGSNIALTFTDRPTELSGRLQDASGRPAAEYFIIVFSADERSWFTRSRRIAQTRPGSDGAFVIRGLPPGDYLLAALTDVERDEWFDAGFLRQLVATSPVKISLAEGEKQIQNVGIRK